MDKQEMSNELKTIYNKIDKLLLNYEVYEKFPDIDKELNNARDSIEEVQELFEEVL